ncbi:PEP/pyruvate-binding domain-containing protein [Streptomyces sp. NPDC006739]|uniref:PEP/pyruvate-binding domain-containing protein n=1 Tax=Streptomyces sp. NPDC006739 TaxID=3364763 RepID=UPI0036CA5E87
MPQTTELTATRPQLIAPGADALGDPGQVGHKFSRQHVMRRAGLPVPAFFVLTAEAFTATVPAPEGFPGPDASTAELADWARAARDRVRAAPLPAGPARRVLAAFDELAGPDGLVAVRGCTAAEADGTGEDGADDPFAGLSDSYLYVRRDAVLDRIADCWASAYNPEAVLYRVRRGVDVTAVRVAVGVQRMVPGVRSFVMFTSDPRGGGTQAVVAAAHGIGEGIVQEKADIDHFFMDRADGSVRADIAVKTTMVGLDPDRPDAGPVRLPVPAPLARPPVLSDEEVRRIGALAARAEELFGGPQDVEGTLTADGAIHLVQARPVVRGPMAPAGPAAAPVPWTNHNLTESFPGVTSALTYSQARVFYRTGFADFYRRLGVPEHSLRRDQHHLSRMIGHLDGRVYYRLDAWFALHGQIPGFDLIRPMWQRSLGLTETPEDAVPDPAARRRAWRQVLRSAPRLGRAYVTQPRRLRQFLRWWDGLMAQWTSFEDCTPDELVARYRTMWTEAEHRWGVTMVASYFALVSLTCADALLNRWVPDGAALLPRLLGGGRPNRTLASVRSSLALAEHVGADLALRTAVLERPEREVWQEITSGVYGQEVAEAFARHLRSYGDRALHDLKLEVLTPRQEPWRIVSALRPFVTQGLTVAANEADEAAARDAARRALREACPGPLRRAVLGAVLASLRFSVKAREDTRFCRSQLYGVSREVLWRLARDLVEAGLLDHASDVVHLQVEEVLGAFDGTLTETDLRALVRRRAARHAECAATAEPPAYFTVPGGLPVPVALASRHDTAAGTGPAEDGVLRGIASSSGTARGRALVVRDTTVPPERCVGRILVAKETDPGWLALMMAAKGIVVERGSLVSHTAISGRLLGVPTVVAVREAMTAIPDGAWIEIDGTTGTVRLLPGETAPEEA